MADCSVSSNYLSTKLPCELKTISYSAKDSSVIGNNLASTSQQRILKRNQEEVFSKTIEVSQHNRIVSSRSIPEPQKQSILTRGICTSHGKNNYSNPKLPRRKLLIITVGLPAQGKSFLTQKLAGYLNWIGYNAQVFDLAEERRAKLGLFYSHDWYRSDNIKAEKARTKIKHETLDKIFTWFKNDGHVALLDANCCTQDSRESILQYIDSQQPNLHIKSIFVELLADQQVVQKNIVKQVATSPDYKNLDQEKATRDLLEKIYHLAQAYESVDNHNRFIQIFGTSDQVIASRISGFLPSRIMCFISNLRDRTASYPVYLVRHGQSEYNIMERLGGDPGLTNKGLKFARNLSSFIHELLPDARSQLTVWTSTLKRAIQTAENIPCTRQARWKALDEILTGVCDSMTYEEIKEQMPREYEARAADKFRYRYPHGESYEDLIQRLEPIVIEVERRTSPIMIVAHQAVLRCLYAYFTHKPRVEIPHIEFPSCCVVKMQPSPYTTEEDRYFLDVPSCKN